MENNIIDYSNSKKELNNYIEKYNYQQRQRQENTYRSSNRPKLELKIKNN